jgi:hypothetical protein
VTTKTAKKVTGPVPAAGAVQTPVTDVLVVALGFVMPPQPLCERAPEPAASDPAIAPYAPGYVADAKAAAQKPRKLDGVDESVSV